jgi:LacI family transcriptional regulator
MKPMQRVPHILLLLRWYDYRIHRGVAQVAREAGWQLICPKGEQDTRQAMDLWKGDGCISLFDGDVTLGRLHHQGIPLIDLGLAKLGFTVPKLVTDNREIGRLAAEHFLDHGYREIFAPHPGNIAMYQERLNAVTHFMQAQGGAVHILQPLDVQGAGLLDQLRAIAVARDQRLRELSIGVFVYEDYNAATLVSACLEHGLQVPHNVAILGVDNDDLINDGLAIGLSSIDSDQEGLGRAGAELLRQMLEHPDHDYTTEIYRHPPKGIVARQSTDGYAVGSPLVAKALHWIAHHVHEGIQAINVARAMNVSQQGLQKAFAAHHVRSPGKEIRHQRAQVAKDQLMHTSHNLATIAQQCGYETVDTLISNFKEAYDTTPGQYRKHHRKKHRHPTPASDF